MEFNVVSKSDFSDSSVFSRLDAAFMSPSLVELEKKLRDATGAPLGALASAYEGPTINDAFAKEEDPVAYISIDSVDNEDGLTYTDELLFRDRPSRAKYVVEEGDILVSNVRPNRNAVALISSRNSGALASSGFTLLRKAEGSPLAVELILAFLKTEFGRDQLMRRDRGSMYPAVLARDVFDVWVPFPPNTVAKKVISGVKQGARLNDDFFKLVGQLSAEIGALLEPLGAPPSPLETNRDGVDYRVVNSHDFFAAEGPRRIDAEFFRQEYEDFEEHGCKLWPSFRLGDLYHLSPGRGLGDGEVEIPFIKQGVLTNAGVNWSALSFELGGVSEAGPDVRVGDILLACTAHEIYYVGRKVDLVRHLPDTAKGYNAAVADLMIVRPQDGTKAKVPGSYVAAFLRSPAGLHQVQRCIRGLRGGHVYRNDLSRYVRVPLPPKKWLDKFEALSKQAEKKRLDGKRTLLGAFDAMRTWVKDAVVC